MPIDLRAEGQRRWLALDPRLRSWIRLSAPLLIAVAVWSLLWVPSAQMRQRLGSELPALRQQLAQMQAEAAAINQAGASAAAPSPDSHTAPTLADLQTSLRQHGLDQAQWQSHDGHWQLQLASVSYPAWIGWLQFVANRYDLHLVQADIKVLPVPATVSVQAELAPAANISP